MNRALRIHAYGGSEVVHIDDVPLPKAADGEIVVRVHAAGINPLDWKVRDGLMREVFPLTLPATLGIELAGEIVEIGAGVSGFAIGERVVGPLAGLGAFTDHVAIAASNLTLTPKDLDDVRAAAISVASLTAWQALFEAGALKRGQTVLIHGAAGGVGSFAVQFARRIGAHVLCTAQGVNAGYLRALGANEVIDYRSSAFWEIAHDVDLVLDLVGGATLAHSWQVLGDNGRIVSTATPEVTTTATAGKRGIWFQMRPDPARLAEIANLLARGELSVEISETASFDQTAAVIERNKTGHGPGKAVITFG
ncbi:NADP-dependent oxidoreductase [Dyella silvatica]|uniref:NADP-dependent oxidoreductase n=1 Tax=Dyella silvatica TaxID=2992128 RepID=UPI00224E0D20|nr:NADP-dependent oxidoreductase [Dyella silvatica]